MSKELRYPCNEHFFFLLVGLSEIYHNHPLIISTSVTELWKYFYKNDTYYKTDRTHKAVWCKDGHIQTLIECDRARA
ncbi:hypothetical protein BJ165DRAFT_1519932 [Panaeolus papilionaceus]|nr:hypothetical protein BJ165DRAFT_1519932 [Panaeolus papilionaceus]